MASTLQGLVDSSSVEAEIRGDAEVAGLAYDSRDVVPGDLFCCIPGDHLDRHDFATAAIDAGASALLVERFLDVDAPQAKVAHIRSILGPLSDAFFGHPSRQLQIAAVTGTNGKTTTTYLFESIVKAAGRRAGVVGNVTRRFPGVEEEATRNLPEAVDIQRLFRRMVDASTETVVIEATSDGLAAGRLRGTHLHTAAFTNLTQDHLNTHGSMESYFEAKALLFEDGYTTRAVVNVDDPYGRRLVERIGSLEVLTFGSAGAISLVRSEQSDSGSDVQLRTPAGDMTFSTHLVGPYNVSNCMCAVGMALHCGVSLEDAVAGIASLDHVPGRLERVDGGQSFLALVDYAHTPDALEQALGACRALAGDHRVIVVFGCGGDRDTAKRPQMGEIATRLADMTYITSDNPRSEEPEAIVAEIEVGATRGGGAFSSIVDRTDAIAAALSEATDGDVVLVAGKGHEQGQQFATRTIPYDDRQVVGDLLEHLCPR